MANPSAGNKGPLAGLALIVALIIAHEGFRDTTYLDPVGIPTSCWGHVGPENKPGRKFTRDECKALLEADVLTAMETVKKCIPVNMPGHVFAAFVSFTYNVGPGKPGVKDGLCWLKSGKQSTLRALANAGDFAGACAQLSLWVKAKGIKLPGLVNRRAVERAVCEGRTTIP